MTTATRPPDGAGHTPRSYKGIASYRAALLDDNPHELPVVERARHLAARVDDDVIRAWRQQGLGHEVETGRSEPARPECVADVRTRHACLRRAGEDRNADADPVRPDVN